MIMESASLEASISSDSAILTPLDMKGTDEGC